MEVWVTRVSIGLLNDKTIKIKLMIKEKLLNKMT